MQRVVQAETLEFNAYGQKESDETVLGPVSFADK